MSLPAQRLGVILVVLLSCTSPTAPPPTGSNANITGTVVERVDGPPYSFLRPEFDEKPGLRGIHLRDSGYLAA
jgi:hypothetical protein